MSGRDEPQSVKDTLRDLPPVEFGEPAPDASASWRVRSAATVREPAANPFDEATDFEGGDTKPRVRFEVRHKAIGARRSGVLPADEVIIGRGGPGVHVALTWDRHASRRHVRLWSDEGGRLMVTDLGSRNGTFLDKRPLKGTLPITPDNVLRIGATRIRVRLEEEVQVVEEQDVLEVELQPKAEAETLPEVSPSARNPTVALPRPSRPKPSASGLRSAVAIPAVDTVDLAPPPRAEPEAPTEPAPASAPKRHPALDVLGPFLDAMARRDVYGALTLQPTCSAEQIESRLTYLRTAFTEAQAVLPVRQAERVSSALELLDKARKTLTTGRLEYDFRQGHDRLEQRRACAGEPGQPSMEALREAWRRAKADRYKVASRQALQAQNARKRGQLPRAIELAKDALRDDPFNEELHERLSFWETLASARR